MSEKSSAEFSNEPIKSLQQVREFKVAPERLFYSASHEEIMRGYTSDIYFVRSQQLLNYAGLADTKVVAEIFPSRGGVFCGVEECVNLLKWRKVSLWAIEEGDQFQEKEVVMRIEGPYSEFGVYETAILGFLASSSAWATAAREAKKAAGQKPVICFGARHIHPAVAPVMERAAVIGGADGASCILGAKLLGREPSGTIPHAAILIVGDTVRAARLYHESMPPDAPRTILIDTFKDEAEEALRVAEALGEALNAVRLDTPGERGGVTPWLVKEIRYRLDLVGYGHVKIFVSGGLNPDRISELSAYGADAFGVGSYISAARPIDMTLDLKVIGEEPVAKRGRLPGITDNPRLRRWL